MGVQAVIRAREVSAFGEHWWGCVARVAVRGHSLYFSATVAGYHGPGEYAGAGSGALTGTISVGVGAGGAQQPTYSIFRSVIGGSSSMTVRPDGSGTFTFSEWGSDEVRGVTGSAASISGTVSWTCSVP